MGSLLIGDFLHAVKKLSSGFYISLLGCIYPQIHERDMFFFVQYNSQKSEFWNATKPFSIPTRYLIYLAKNLAPKCRIANALGIFNLCFFLLFNYFIFYGIFLITL